MLAPDEMRYILEMAYVPEHSPELMTAISGGEPFLLEDCLVVVKEDWLALVGYPCATGPNGTGVVSVEEVWSRFKTRRLRFIGPSVPDGLAGACRENDHYYRIDLDGYCPPARLGRAVETAAAELTVERATVMGNGHRALIADFLAHQPPAPRVRELFHTAPEWLPRSSALVLLNAWDRKGNLAAFHVADTAPSHFAASILGCRSRTQDTPHAADLLFSHLIGLACEQGKDWINLGLGVNEGIRRFKRKWGGKPFLAYACCEQQDEERPTWLSCLHRLGNRI
jgi:hypothetical protein